MIEEMSSNEEIQNEESKSTTKENLSSYLKPLKELGDKLAKDNHPYGLLLMSAPLTIASGTNVNLGFPQVPFPVLSSSAVTTEQFSDTSPGTPTKLLRDLSLAGSAAGSFSADAGVGKYLSSSGLALSSLAEKNDDYHVLIGAALSAGGLSSAPAIEAITTSAIPLTSADNNALEQTMLPMVSSLRKANLESVDSTKEIEVTKEEVRVGSIQAKVYEYKGENSYLVEGDGLEEPYNIKPKDKLLVLHVNQNADKYSNLGPLAKVKKFKEDFNNLCGILENPEDFDLTEEEKETVSKVAQAPMIGVSHLVRLVAKKNVPTWDIDILPKPMRLFHKIDSQIVSKLFGGKGNVESKDVSVLFLPASMRQKILN